MCFSITDREYKCSSHQIGERFLTTFDKLKVVSPTGMAKLATDSAILEYLVINREIFISNREIGRLSLLYQQIGRSPAKSGDLEALVMFGEGVNSYWIVHAHGHICMYVGACMSA